MSLGPRLLTPRRGSQHNVLYLNGYAYWAQPDHFRADGAVSNRPLRWNGVVRNKDRSVEYLSARTRRDALAAARRRILAVVNPTGGLEVGVRADG